MRLEGSRRPSPPASSYWVGASREELNARVTARRPQQRSVTVAELMHDPALAATLALKQDKRWKVIAKAVGRN